MGPVEWWVVWPVRPVWPVWARQLHVSKKKSKLINVLLWSLISGRWLKKESCDILSKLWSQEGMKFASTIKASLIVKGGFQDNYLFNWKFTYGLRNLTDDCPQLLSLASSAIRYVTSAISSKSVTLKKHFNTFLSFHVSACEIEIICVLYHKVSCVQQMRHSVWWDSEAERIRPDRVSRVVNRPVSSGQGHSMIRYTGSSLGSPKGRHRNGWEIKVNRAQRGTQIQEKK